MLAVRPEYRNFNLGAKLKLAQLEAVLKQGIGVMSWTFDPLQSLNADFNLGVVSDEYLVDFYGDDAPSFLHQNGTVSGRRGTGKRAGCRQGRQVTSRP